MAQLSKRLSFNLPDSLSGHGEILSDLLERMFTPVANTKPHFDYLLLARGQGPQYVLGLLLEVKVDDSVGGGDFLTVLDENGA